MLKVTAYCRVSTDNDDQLNSLANQEQYFKDYINTKLDWVYVPLYVDEGLSGTSTKKRKMFNKMISDAKSGAFDLILTKEVSRFARNTVDTLHFTRELKELGIGVIFITDNIDSRDHDGEFRLTIMAAMAQDESRRTSQRVRWGQERSMERGVVFGQKMFGYSRNNGKLEIIPSEAETVRLIYHKYLEEAKGLLVIAKELEKIGILTSYGKKSWDSSGLLRLLKNEKYCGDLKQKKFITPNYLTQQSKRNKGEERFIIIRNNHPAIISRDVFDRTQNEIARRALISSDGSKYTSRYAFSGKLKCGLCGANLISRYNKSSDGRKEYRRWRCATSFKYGAGRTNEKGCPSKTVCNEILEQVFLLTLGDFVTNKDEIINECVQAVSGTLNSQQVKADYTEAQKELDRLNSRIDGLIDLRLGGEITKEELQEKREPINKQIAMAEKKLLLLCKNIDTTMDYEAHLISIKSYISGIVNTELFSDDVVKEVLDKIVVHSKNRYDVYFRGTTANFTCAV